LGDDLFESYLGVDKSVVAKQVGNQIYVRNGSQSMLSDLVHEGTHMLDYNNSFGINGASTWHGKNRHIFMNDNFNSDRRQSRI